MYSHLTKDELIAELTKRDEQISLLEKEIERKGKFNTLLVRAIIHHYNQDNDEDNSPRGFPKSVQEE